MTLPSTSTIDPSQWNALDWTLAIIVVFSAVRAFMRGLVRALFSLMGIIAGFELASWNYVGFADQLHRGHWIASTPTARIVAFLAIVVGIVLAFELAGWAIRRTAHAIGLGIFDRIFGAVFGLVRGILLGVVVVTGMQAFTPQSAMLTGSKLARRFLAATHAISFEMPNGFR